MWRWDTADDDDDEQNSGDNEDTGLTRPDAHLIFERKKAHGARVRSVAFSADGFRLVTASEVRT